ncbi:hypothetical protein SAMN05216299_1232 [Nitrosospira sp. Nsp14]|nr:hypothetical protein SAMN05216299_1232 [Nitrosospira sp. Nsp14]
MAVYLVTYDLKAPGRNYDPVYDYLRGFIHCKGLESVWLIQTALSSLDIRDKLMSLIDSNDVIFVARLSTTWGSYRYSCANWLNEPSRSW